MRVLLPLPHQVSAMLQSAEGLVIACHHRPPHTRRVPVSGHQTFYCPPASSWTVARTRAGPCGSSSPTHNVKHLLENSLQETNVAEHYLGFECFYLDQVLKLDESWYSQVTFILSRTWLHLNVFEVKHRQL